MMHLLLGGRYGLTELGEVYSLLNNRSVLRSTPKLLKTRTCPAGYLAVALWDGAGYTYPRIHRLVATALIPNPDNKPQINHINGLKLDNRKDNLEWCTRSENAIHAYAMGVKKPPCAMSGRFNEKHPRSRPIRQLLRDGTVVNTYPSINEAGRAGFHMSNIVSALKGRNYTSAGFRWEYVI